jgi:hypothetical protein
MKRKPTWLLAIPALIVLRPVEKLHAQTVAKTQLSISVAGVEYDDAGFAKLKLNIKSNKKVQDLKQSFSQNIARLSLIYQGEATDLWDEIPADLKQPFKITTIESNRIDLQLKNAIAASTKTSPVTNANTASNTTGTDDCKNCYWNMCKYDVVKSIGGKTYKDIITESGTVYYNCDMELFYEHP